MGWRDDPWFDWVRLVDFARNLGSRKDERARKITNSIAISQQYKQIWGEDYDSLKHGRVLAKSVDLVQQPISTEEDVFVTMLILHLSMVFRAMRNGEFVKFEGLQRDVREFFALPIPKAVWRKVRPFQDRDFAQFIDNSLK